MRAIVRAHHAGNTLRLFFQLHFHWRVVGAEQQFLQAPVGFGWPGGKHGCHFVGLGHQLVGGDHAIDDAPFHCLLRGQQTIGQQQFLGSHQTHVLGEKVG